MAGGQLLQKKWHEDQQTLLEELNRLVNCYRFPGARVIVNQMISAENWDDAPIA